MPRPDQLYSAARERFCVLAETLAPAQLATVVPATPAWTVQQVLAHVVGVCADNVGDGGLAGASADEWTAAQVRTRTGRGVHQLAAEWDAVGPRLEAGLRAGRVTTNVVHDLATHELDVCEALGLPAGDGWRPLLEPALAGRARPRVPGTLVLRVDGSDTELGDGEPVVTTEVGAYELYRALFSRRSRAQLRAWPWSGDPTACVQALGVFGPRDDDQPLPA